MPEEGSASLDLLVEDMTDDELDLIIDEISIEELATIIETVAPGKDYIAAFKRFMAIYARNLSEIEATAEEAEAVSTATAALSDEVQTALSEIDQILESSQLSRWSRLNRPNLLKQSFWTYSSGVGRNVVYGNASRISGNTYACWKSFNDPTVYELEEAPTAAQLAEACAYYTGTDNNNDPFYYLYKDEDDWRVSLVDLGANNAITDADGEVYQYAIGLDITGNTAYANWEYLCFYNPTNSTSWRQTTGAVYTNHGQIEEMTPGKRYTLSFWARVTSGTGAIARLGYGNSYMNPPYKANDGKSDYSDWIEIAGSEWTRYHWTFDYNPAGDWYTETTEEATDSGGNSYTKVVRTYNYFKKVVFGFGRKYTATIQICGFRLVQGELEINTRYDELKEMLQALEARVSALEG